MSLPLKFKSATENDISVSMRSSQVHPVCFTTKYSYPASATLHPPRFEKFRPPRREIAIDLKIELPAPPRRMRDY